MKNIDEVEFDQDLDFSSLFGFVDDNVSCAEYYGQQISALNIPEFCSFYRLLLLVWQVRSADLQKQYDLADPKQRVQYFAWCLCHGAKEYQSIYELKCFWLDLNKKANVPSSRYSDGISVLMILWCMQDLKLQAPPLVESEIFYKQMIQKYWFGGGALGVRQPMQYMASWHKNFLLDVSSIEDTRFARLLHDYRLDLREAFDLNTEDGRSSYKRWLLTYGMQETPLKKIFDKPLKAWPAVACAKKNLRAGVNLIGYAYGQLGIGEDVRMAARALDAAEIPFTIVNFDAGPQISNNDFSVQEWVSDEPIYSINLICLTAIETARLYLEKGGGLFQGRYNIGYWPWELEYWPSNWNHLFALVDEVWASSKHIKRALDRVSVVPVRWMPMSVVVERPVAKKSVLRDKFGLPLESVLFIFSFDGGSSLQRKNPMAIVEAFKLAFPLGSENTGLVIKCMRQNHDDPAWSEIVAATQQDNRMIILDVTLSKDQVVELYAACDCFVSLHRAEGFGRGIAEALLLGMNVIATGYGGNTDFCSTKMSHLVPAELVRVKSGHYPESMGNFWAEPSALDAALLLQKVYKDVQGDDQFAEDHSEVLNGLFSPSSIGGRYKEVIKSFHELVG